MEVVFYNESTSILNQQTEIFHAYVLSLFADTVRLHCHNSSLYNLYSGNHQWSDQKIKELFGLFEEHTHNELKLKHDQVEMILTNTSRMKKIAHKNSKINRLLYQSLEMKRKLKELLEVAIEDVLTENRVFGLQAVIDKEVVTMEDMLSKIPDKNENIYIHELLSAFRDTKGYQVFGTSVLNTFRIMKQSAARSKWWPHWYKNGFDAFSIDLLNLPLVCDLTADQLLYLREQLYPQAGEFRNQLDIFRNDISEMPFSAENFSRIIELFQQRIGSLCSELQQQIDQQLHIQFLRNNYRDYSLKLLLIISPIYKLIDYYSKTGIVPLEVSETVKRNLNKEMDLNGCSVFFNVTITTNAVPGNK